MEVFPAIPFEKEFEFLQIQIPDTKLQTVHELVLEKLQLGNSRATKYRTLDDSHKGIAFESEYEKVETLHSDKEKWQFTITIKEPILNNKKYVWIRFKIDVDYTIESPEIIFEYNIKDKGHYVKLRTRGLFKNQYSTMELTKNDLINEIHFHNIKPE